MVKKLITKTKADKYSKEMADVQHGIHKDMHIEVFRPEIVLELLVDRVRSKECQQHTKMSQEVRHQMVIKKKHYTRDAYISGNGFLLLSYISPWGILRTVPSTLVICHGASRHKERGTRVNKERDRCGRHFNNTYNIATHSYNTSLHWS